MILPFQLDPDNVPPFDFNPKSGVSITVFAENDSNSASITAASMNETELRVDTNGRLTFTALSGINRLSLVFSAAAPSEELRLMEFGGDGPSRIIARLRPQDDLEYIMENPAQPLLFIKSFSFRAEP